MTLLWMIVVIRLREKDVEYGWHVMPCVQNAVSWKVIIHVVRLRGAFALHYSTYASIS